MKACILIIVICVLHYSYSCTSKNLDGTTRNLREIFIGRCYEFFHGTHQDKCNINPNRYDCNEIWYKFKEIVIGKDPCEIKMDDFNSFLKSVDHPIKTNSALFWSGTYTPAHEISKYYGYWSLEDTLSGYLLNKLIFCSEKNLQKFNEKSCPNECVKTNNSYWYAASKYFAQKVRGQVTVVLNGTRTIGAVSNTSTFLNYELPNFKKNNVKLVRVILLHRLGTEKYETCNEPKSLHKLESILMERNIRYECQDNPKYIIGLFCFQNPMSKECQSIKYLINV